LKRALPIACLLWVGLAASAWAASALQYTRATLEEASAIVASQRAHNEKLQALSALFKNFLDTDEMGRIALGGHWASFTPPQRKEFLVLFGRLLERTYVQKLLLFENPRFEYSGETRADSETRVDTSIVTPRDDFAVVYLLRPAGARWLATSIKVENVSLTANLGSQLDRLLAKSSVPDVLDLMRRKYGDGGGTNQ
jgi:phospholipid transport system substrate-binding protein